MDLPPPPDPPSPSRLRGLLKRFSVHLILIAAFVILVLRGAFTDEPAIDFNSPNRQVHVSQLLKVFPVIIPDRTTPLNGRTVQPTRCHPALSPQVTQSFRFDGGIQDGELVVRRLMANESWRDLPDDSTWNTHGATLRFQHGVGNSTGTATITYRIAKMRDGSKLQMQLVGSTDGRCD